MSYRKERYTKKLIGSTIEYGLSENKKTNIRINTEKNNRSVFNDHAYSYFSNLNKVYWNKTSTHRQITKKDLIEYYDKISKYIFTLSYRQPLSLSRYPDGIKGKSFYQKNWSNTMVAAAEINIYVLLAVAKILRDQGHEPGPPVLLQLHALPVKAG